MTQEERNNAKHAFCERMYRDGLSYDPSVCFDEGVEWADEHPKSPLISVEDDLTCNHEEMVHVNYTDRVLILARNGFAEVAFMTIIEGKWEWCTPIHVAYWMPIPNVPKL